MENSRPNYYAVIPADVRYDDRLEANAKLLYGEIAALVSADGYCFALNAFFMENYGWSDRTVSRLLASLEDNGHIRRVVIKDKSGHVVQRKIYLRVSLPDVQPPDKIVTTPCQNFQEGGDKNGGDTVTSITVKKENKKEKADKPPLSDDELRTLVKESIQRIATPKWSREEKNGLFALVVELYNPDREVRKAHPMRTVRSVNRTFNKLVEWACNDPRSMMDIVDRAIANGWQGIQPPNGG
ncbi:MAG: helix-turn-helix domain-containing protein, partial [Faecousia sp.]